MHSSLAALADVVYGKSPIEVADRDGSVPILGTGGEYGRALRPMFNSGIVVPRKGSLSNPQLSLDPFWPTDTTFAVLPFSEVDTRWLYYCLSNYNLAKLNEATGVPSISRDWLLRVNFFNPGRLKQSKIADVLQTIDRAIEKTEALIDKYQQIKAGLMHDLFTRGIGADGKLRPPREQAPKLYQETPIGWIPKEWGYNQLDSLLASVPNNLRSGPFGSSLLKAELVESGIPFLGIDNIHIEKFKDDFRRFVSEKKFLELSKYAVRPRDVVITIMGTVGRSAVIPDGIGQALSSKHLWTMTFDSEVVIPELVCWRLNYAPWVKSWFRKETQGGIMDAIQSRTLRTVILPVIPMEEQEYIFRRYSTMNDALASEEQKLDKLRKEKSGLMHDLLTGKVPVQIESEAEPEAAHV